MMASDGLFRPARFGGIPWVPSRTTHRPPTISTANPAGTDGFEFVEFAHPEPEKLAELFTRMGYVAGRQAQTKDITVWRQGDINYVAQRRARLACDAASSTSTAPARRRWPGAWSTPSTPSTMPSPRAPTPYEGDDKALDVPAIVGIGGSLLYFVDTLRREGLGL